MPQEPRPPSVYEFQLIVSFLSCWYSAMAWPPKAPTCHDGLSTTRYVLVSASAVAVPKPWLMLVEPCAYCTQMWLPPPKNLSCTCSTVKPKPSLPLTPPCESALEKLPTRRSLPSGLTG